MSGVALATEQVCGGVKTSESEFQKGLTAACGPDAAATAARWADQSSSKPTTVDVFNKMRSLRLGGSNGLSDLSELETTLREMGYKIVLPERGEGVYAFMRRMAGKNAVVWETANGQALKDFLTKHGEDAVNLERHILTSWGTNSGGASALTNVELPDGFWMSDGDNDSQNLKDGVRYHWPINNRLVYYPTTVVNAARPIGAFAVAPRVLIPGGHSGMLDISQVSGWFTQVSANEWKAKKTGVPILDDALNFYRSLPGLNLQFGELPFIGLPIIPRFYVGDVSFTICERGVVIFDPKRTNDNPPDATGHCYLGHIDDPRIITRLMALRGISAPPSSAPEDPVAAQWLAIGRAVAEGLQALPPIKAA